MKTVGIIPSRFGSSRFPGKPLADICGKPMIWWVYQQAIKSEALDDIIVATDDVRITDVCNQYGMKYLMTSKDHKNGTERICEASRLVDSEIYITIQGDEPLIEPENIRKVVEIMKSDASVDCATLKTPFRDPVDVINQTTPKVVSDLNDNVLLFTRSPVPYPKAALGYTIFKPMGIYGFRANVLRKYEKLEMGPLEAIEEIELLRFIEHGIKVKIKATESHTVAVDTKKDLDRVRTIIETQMRGGGQQHLKIINECNHFDNPYFFNSLLPFKQNRNLIIQTSHNSEVFA